MGRNPFPFVVACALLACQPGGEVPIGSSPGGGADADAEITGPEPDAGPLPALPSATPLSDPPGLVEGAEAEALRGHATGAVYMAEPGLDWFGYWPVTDGVPGEEVRLSPPRGRDYGRGAGRVAAIGSSETDLIIGFDDAEASVGRMVGFNIFASGGAAGRPRVEQGLTEGLSPAAWYRVGLDGRDADRPRLLMDGVDVEGFVRLTSDGRFLWFQTPAGLGRVATDGRGAPEMRVPVDASGRSGPFALFDATGELLYIRAADDRREAELRAAPLDGPPGASRRVMDLGPVAPGVPVLGGLYAIDDRHAVALTTDGRTALVSPGRDPEIVFLPERINTPWIVVGDRFVFVDADGRLAAIRLDGSDADAPRIVAPSVTSLELAHDGEGRLAMIHLSEQITLVVASTDGSSPEYFPIDQSLQAGDGPLAFVPGENAVVHCASLGLMRVDLITGDVETLATWDASTRCDLSLVQAHGVAAVYEAGRATLVSVRTGERHPLWDDGYGTCDLAPGGITCRHVSQDRSLRRADAPHDTELAHEEAPRGLELVTPDGTHAITGALEPEDIAVFSSEAAELWAHRLDRSAAAVHLGRAAFLSPILAYRAEGIVLQEATDDLGVESRVWFVPYEGGWEARRLLGEVRRVLGVSPEAGVVAEVEDGVVAYLPEDASPPRVLFDVAALEGRRHYVDHVRVFPAQGRVAIVVTIPTWEDVENRDSTVIWTPLDPEADPTPPVVLRIPDATVETVEAAGEPGHLVAAITTNSSPWFARLELGGEAPRVVRLSPVGTGAARDLSDLYRAVNWTGLAGRPAWLSAGGDRALLERKLESAGAVVYAVATDAGSEAELVELLDGTVTCEGTGRFLPDGLRALLFARDGGVWVADTRDGTGARVSTWYDLGFAFCAFAGAFRAETDAAGRLVFIDIETFSLVTRDLATGAVDVRLQGDAEAVPRLQRLTPDGTAAIVQWRGPHGRRLYVVTLDGPPRVAALAPTDLDQNERLLGFASVPLADP